MTTPQRSTSDNTGRHAGELREELDHDASRLKDSLGARARQEAEKGKGQAGQVAGSASSALNLAAEDLRRNPDAPDWMASGLQQAAQRIERLANHIDERGIDDLRGEAARFARENPGTFLVAAAAAGFAAARVMRAGADRKRHDHDRDDNEGQPDWPADENVKPQQTGSGFTPAYSGNSGTGGAAL